MVSVANFREFALSLPETEESPHFEIISFRIKKKIFATINPSEQRATLKFTPELQDIFKSLGKGAIFPVPNRWGLYGWTHLDLSSVEWELCQDALRTAWWETAPPALRKKHALFFGNEEGTF